MTDRCEGGTCKIAEIDRLRACLSRAEANVAMVEAKWRAEAFANGKTCPHCGWDEPQCDCQTLAAAVKAAVAAAATEAHPGDHERTMMESHCAKCVRCQAYKQMADDEAKRYGLRATSYREELLQIVSYLGHYDQDANHAWMVRRIRAVLAGKDPNTVEGWSMLDGVPAPTGSPAKVVGTAYPPPKELWFHFHPAPHVIAPDGEERLAASGDLWHDPYESKEEAVAALGEEVREGWVVVGPYIHEGGALQLQLQQMADLQAQVATMRAETDACVAQTLAMRDEFDRDREKFDRERAEFDRAMFVTAGKKENPS